MALTPQTIQLPFQGGIDESTQPHLVDPRQAFHSIQNLTHTKRGALSKSPGTVTAPYTLVDLDAAAITTGRTLDSLGDKLVASDASGVVRVWSPAFAAWAEVGELPECTVTRRPIAGTASDTPYVFSVYNANADVIVVAWVQQGTTASANMLHTAVIERTTGATLATSTVTNTSHCRMVSCGDNVVVVLLNNSGNLVSYYLDATNPTAGWTTTGLSWAGSSIVSGSGILTYDLLPVSSTVFIAAYGLAAGASRIQLQRVDCSTWTATHSATVSTAGNPTAVLALGGTDLCWVAYAYDFSARTVALSLTDLTSVGTTDTWTVFVGEPIWFSVVTTGTQTANVYGSCDNTTLVAASTERGALSISAGAVSSTSEAYLTAQPAAGAGHAFRVNGVDYCPMWTTQGDGVNLLRLDGTVRAPNYFDGVGVASYGQRLTAGLTSELVGSAHMRAMDFGSSLYGFVGVFKRAPGSYSAEVVTFDFTPERPTRTLFGEALQYSGGVVTQYDGRDLATVSHVERPVIAASNSTAGSGVGNGTYLYTAVYERQDAAGQWHPSAPADPVSHTVSGGPRFVNIELSNPAVLRTSIDRYRVAVYRTVAAGGTYYLVKRQNLNSVSPFTQVVDNVADATLDDQETLYTQPGQLGTSRPRRAPPALRHLCVHQDRIAGVAEDGVTVWYSAPRVPGEGAWFDDAFQFQVEQGGDITALWSQDGRLVVAKRRALYVVDGDGPPENGGNGNEFSPPVRLPVHVGCVTSRALATSDAGTFFVSERGIELLTRSMQVAWIGEAIEDTLAAYPDVASILVEPLTSLVRFLLVDDIDTPTACRLAVYDMNNKSWEVRTLPAVAVDQCIHDGVWHFIATTGQVYKENTASYLDGSTWRTASLETAWISMGLLQDQHTWSAHLLFEQHTDHDLTVEVAYNHDDSIWTTQGTYDSDEVAASDGQIEIRPANARARAIKLRISDATPTGTANTVGTGRGSTWIGLAVDIAPRVGTTKGAPRVGADARR